jgi:hypothetical protein
MDSILKKRIRSILGLNTVKAFIVVLLSLAIIAIVTIIILGALSSSNALPQLNGNVINETTAFINQTVDTLNVLNNASFSGVTNCAVTIAYNSSSNLIIAPGNYTVNSGACTWTNATAVVWNNTLVSYTFSYNSVLDNQANSIGGNVSGGITSFFTNSSTFFALLGVVVIILIISLVVVVVNRFGGGESSGTAQNPSL